MISILELKLPDLQTETCWAMENKQTVTTGARLANFFQRPIGSTTKTAAARSTTTTTNQSSHPPTSSSDYVVHSSLTSVATTASLTAAAVKRKRTSPSLTHSSPAVARQDSRRPPSLRHPTYTAADYSIEQQPQPSPSSLLSSIRSALHQPPPPPLSALANGFPAITQGPLLPPQQPPQTQAFVQHSLYFPSGSSARPYSGTSCSEQSGSSASFTSFPYMPMTTHSRLMAGGGSNPGRYRDELHHDTTPVRYNSNHATASEATPNTPMEDKSTTYNNYSGARETPNKRKREQDLNVGAHQAYGGLAGYPQQPMPRTFQQPPQPQHEAVVPPITMNTGATPAAVNVEQPSWDDKDGYYIIVPNTDLTPRYKILRLLGQGTFGKVVECWDRENGRRVAVKIIRAIPKYRDAAKLEIRVLNCLKEHDPTNAKYVSFFFSNSSSHLILLVAAYTCWMRLTSRTMCAWSLNSCRYRCLTF